MKIRVLKSDLSKILFLSYSIVYKKHTMPVLSNLKLVAENNSLSITASDLEVTLISNIPAEIDLPGSITVDGGVLYEIVKELPEQPICFNLANRQKMDIECGHAKFKINVTSADEYPDVGQIVLENPVTVDSSRFYEMLDKTCFAISTDDSKKGITGLCARTIEGSFGIGKYCLRMVATDGHRLAVIDRPSQGFNLDYDVIIPRRSAAELKKVLEGQNTSANISVHNGLIVIEIGSTLIAARLQEGIFPDYKKVIPEESSTIVTVAREEFLSALRRVSLVTTDKNKGIRFKIVDGNMIMSSSSPEYGDAVESVEVEQSGNDVSIGFSAKYTLDLLSAMSSSEKIIIKLNGDSGPGLFQPMEDNLYLCVVMPMRYEQSS